MDVSGILITGIGKPLAKFLLKKFLSGSDPLLDVGNGLIDVASSKFQTVREQEKAQRVFADITDHVIQQLVPLFERAVSRGEANIEAVVFELRKTLESQISADFFLAQDLDAARLVQAFREARPLPGNQYSDVETRLYERALDLSARCLVEVASQLPRFDVKLAATQLQRLSRMQDDIARTLENLSKVEELFTGNTSGSRYARFEADYRQLLNRSLDHLELFGVDIEPQSRRYKLSVAYISLSLQAYSEDEEDSTLLSAEDIFGQLRQGSGRLLIRGEAGSGKSTLFRWVALQTASSKVIQQEPYSLRAPREQQTVARGESGGVSLSAKGEGFLLPVLIRLRDCKNGRLPSVDEFPSQMAKVLDSPPPGWMRSILEQGRALVLLDGIDEVPNQDRQAIYEDLDALISTYSNCCYLLSTRPTAVEKDWLKPFGFREAIINPLSHFDRDRLIDRWHEAVAKEMERLGRPSGELVPLAEKLKTELRENLPIARLATNPLLAAMVCALHRERSQKLPESQAELCEALCHMILHRREREGGLDLSSFPEAYRTLSYSQKKQIVAELAHRMVINERSVLDREDARSQVAGVLDSTPGHSRDDSDVVLEGLVERSGMLREARPGAVDFIHNTFKEYLAADLFAKRGDYGLLAKNATDPAWQQVLIFAAAGPFGEKGFAEKLIQEILNRKSSRLAGDKGSRKRGHVDNEERQRDLMVVRIRSVAQFLSKQVEAHVDTLRNALFPPRTMAEAEALASAGDVVVPYLKYHEKDAVRSVASSVRALRLIDSEVAAARLKEYAVDSRWTVITELTQAIEPLEIPALRRILAQGRVLPSRMQERISEPGLLVDEFPNIETLDFSYTRISNLSVLSRLSKLKSLNLEGTPLLGDLPFDFFSGAYRLTDSVPPVLDVRPLASLVNLRVLNLNRTPVVDVRSLASLVNLEALYMAYTPVLDISSLESLVELKRLDLSGTQIGSVAALGGLKNLRYLKIPNTDVQDLSPLAGLHGLEHLDLEGMRGRDLDPIYRIKSLRSVVLDASEFWRGASSVEVTFSDGIPF